MSASLLIILALSASPDTVLVTPAWLSTHLGQPGLVVIHADRDRAAYDAGHIAGSRYLPLTAITVERDGVLMELPSVAALDSVLESVGIGDSSRVIITGDALSGGAALLHARLPGARTAGGAAGRRHTGVGRRRVPGRDGGVSPHQCGAHA